MAGACVTALLAVALLVTPRSICLFNLALFLYVQRKLTTVKMMPEMTLSNASNQCVTNVSVHTSAEWWYFMIGCVVNVFILIGNFVAVLLICKHRFLQTATNMLAVSLASADLVIGFSYPLYNVYNYSPWGEQLVSNIYLCASSLFFIITSAGCSLSSIVAISIERYIAVFHPLTYQEKVTKRRICAVLTVIWIYVPLMASSCYFVVGQTTVQYNSQPCTLINSVPGWYFIGICMPQLLLLNVISKVIHIRIYWEASKQENKISYQFTTIGVIYRKEAKAAKMMALISISFTLCWLPYTVTTITLYILGANPCPTTLLVLLDISKMMTLCNSFINPTIYFLKNADFRQAFEKTIFFTCQNSFRNRRK